MRAAVTSVSVFGEAPEAGLSKAEVKCVFFLFMHYMVCLWIIFKNTDCGRESWMCMCVCVCVCVCVYVCHTTQADPLWQPSAGDVVGGRRSKVGARFIMACHLSASPDGNTPLSAALQDIKRSNEGLLSFRHNTWSVPLTNGKMWLENQNVCWVTANWS